ncbi:MMPL family transporter [Streptomyces sp. NBC_01304]|uniref:MMPL family transporter n=1 Tax=Streptomyces sp. NBC_01304 TaxID=2903818 RepID=UPI002E131299|nr:MMPL family transporter [Streptomyces sp. NBC_01304]
MLSALARTATRRPLTVILVWLLLLFLGFGFGTGVFDRLSDAVPDIPGTESDRTEHLMEELDPAGSDMTAVVAGTEVARLRPQIERAVADVRNTKGVAEVPDPFTTPGLTAEDGRALLIPVVFEGGLDEDAEDDAIEDAAGRLRQIDAPQVHVSGGELLGQQMGERAEQDVKNAEIITLPAVLLLLLIIFGGLRAAGLPLVVTVCGVGGAFLILFGFSQVTEISLYVVQITTMMGLGLAVDYALLMVMRFREERRGTESTDADDVVEAVHRTVAHAGRTVLFSGLTVAVSLAGLLVYPSPFLRSMGLAVGAVVVVDMLAAVTLVPALLTRFGRKIAPAKARAKPAGREPGAVFARLARFSIRRPLLVVTVVVAGLVVLALPALGMKIAVGDARSLPKDTEARQLYDTVGAHFPAGTGIDPITVLIRPGAPRDCARKIRALPGIAASESHQLPDGSTVVELSPTGAVDGPTATGLVREIRDLRGDEPVQVAGTAARLVDFRNMLGELTPWAALIVLVGISVLLFAFTGSLLIPLRTLLTTLLSLGAALGVVTWVFQGGHGASWLGGEGLGELNITAPPLIIAIAFGLAMDYELFILSRMRESWLATGNAEEAVVSGLRHSGRVVSCAALLLSVVFAGFMTGGFSPILQIGLGLTLAVLIDATVVRMLLVPATMALLGARAWWAPARLRRVHERYGVRG